MPIQLDEANEALSLIDKTLADYVGRTLVEQADIEDLLLDLRVLIEKGRTT